MYLVLDLKNKTLEDEDNELSFSFDKWSYEARARDTYWGEFKLDNLLIMRSAISRVTFEAEKEVITFEADYDGEGYLSNIYIESKTTYNEKHLIKDLDLFLDGYLSKNPLDGDKGDLTGEIETYFDYDNEEFVFKLNKLVLEEE